MNETLEAKAAGGLEEFASAMVRLAPKHDRCFERTQQDEELVSFNLDGYPFTLSWGEVDRPSIGRTVPVVQFSLCIWHTVGGGRWHPPEDVDTTLIESQSVYDCIRVAFETDKVRVTHAMDTNTQQQLPLDPMIVAAGSALFDSYEDSIIEYKNDHMPDTGPDPDDQRDRDIDREMGL